MKDRLLEKQRERELILVEVGKNERKRERDTVKESKRERVKKEG